MLQKHRAHLVGIIGNDLDYFCNRFVEIDFIRVTVPGEIRSMHGVGKREKAEKVIDTVAENLNLKIREQDRKEWFEKFLAVFRAQPAYVDLADMMQETYNTL